MAVTSVNLVVDAVGQPVTASPALRVHQDNLESPEKMAIQERLDRLELVEWSSWLQLDRVDA